MSAVVRVLVFYCLLFSLFFCSPHSALKRLHYVFLSSAFSRAQVVASKSESRAVSAFVCDGAPVSRMTGDLCFGRATAFQRRWGRAAFSQKKKRTRADVLQPLRQSNSARTFTMMPCMPCLSLKACTKCRRVFRRTTACSVYLCVNMCARPRFGGACMRPFVCAPALCL